MFLQYTDISPIIYHINRLKKKNYIDYITQNKRHLGRKCCDHLVQTSTCYKEPRKINKAYSDNNSAGETPEKSSNSKKIT